MRFSLGLFMVRIYSKRIRSQTFVISSILVMTDSLPIECGSFLFQNGSVAHHFSTSDNISPRQSTLVHCSCTQGMNRAEEKVKIWSNLIYDRPSH